MANNSIYAAFERMWQHITTALAAKSDTSHGHDDIYDAKGSANTALESAKAYTDGVKNDLLNGAGAAYDTLKELGDLIEENKDAIEVLEGIAFNPGSGVPSDWAAEEGEPGHVLNRTHYKTTVETVYVEAQDLNFPWVYGEDYRYKYFMPNATPINGETITIIFGDEIHETVIEFNEYGYYSFNNIDEDQFSIDWDSNNNEVTLFSNVTDCSIFKIFGAHNTCVQLPEEYISYKPGKAVAGQEFYVNGIPTIAGEGAEIFNDYEYNIATGMYSHAEGAGSEALEYASHAEGSSTAVSAYSHAEGYLTVARGGNSHAEGKITHATGLNSHAEGYITNAREKNSHAEGEASVAGGQGSHAEGTYPDYFYVNVSGPIEGSTYGPTYELHGGYQQDKYKHIFCAGTFFGPSVGDGTPVRCKSVTVTDGIITHLTFEETISYGKLENELVSVYTGSKALGVGSHAEGLLTIAASDYQHTQGKFNIADDEGKYAHIVGNGSKYNETSNAHTLDWEGNAWFAGDIKVGGTGQDDPNAKILATVDYVNEAIKAAIDAAIGGSY